MQQQVRDFIAESGLFLEPQARFLDMTAELGELGKELLRASNYGRRAVTPSPAVADELGDCLFALLSLCESLSMDGEAALADALAKYRRRLAASGGIGSEVADI